MASTTSRPSNVLGYQALKELWVRNGGDPKWAATMAGIALAESSGRVSVINNDAGTCDNSTGLWQINYFKGYCATTGKYVDLETSRTAAYGPQMQLAADPDAQARAANNILGGGGGLTAWAGDAVGQVAINNGKQPLTDAQVSSILKGNLGPTGPLGPASPSGAISGAGGTSSGSNLSPTSSGCDNTQFLINGLSLHLLNQCQLKALKGGALILGGATLMLAGAVVLIGKGSSKLPAPVAAVAGFAGGEGRARRQIQREKVTQSQIQTNQTLERASSPRRQGSASSQRAKLGTVKPARPSFTAADETAA